MPNHVALEVHASFAFASRIKSGPEPFDPIYQLRVKALLAERHMSMGKLSRRRNLTLQTVYAVCRNPFHAAQEATLEKIAKTLNVPVSELFEAVLDDSAL